MKRHFAAAFAVILFGLTGSALAGSAATEEEFANDHMVTVPGEFAVVSRKDRTGPLVWINARDIGASGNQEESRRLQALVLAQYLVSGYEIAPRNILDGNANPGMIGGTRCHVDVWTYGKRTRSHTMQFKCTEADSYGNGLIVVNSRNNMTSPNVKNEVGLAVEWLEATYQEFAALQTLKQAFVKVERPRDDNPRSSN